MDIQSFTTRLDQNTNDTLQLAKSCSPSQLTLKPGDKWSVIEILEHIYISDRSVHIVISRPSDRINEAEEIIGDEKMKTMVVGFRTNRLVSPEILRPKGNIADVATFEKMFVEQRELIKQDLRSGKIIVDHRVHKHPFLGDFTISDWLNFLIYHTQRHLEQIKDILK